MLLKSLKRSLIDENVDGYEEYEHQLLSNSEEKIAVWLRRELENCDEFKISVAFITEGGLSLILEQLKILEAKGIQGKIITGDYLNFTQPKALKRLMKFKNIEVKVVVGESFHVKGYFFHKNNIWTMAIGSSNLTQKALTVNFEWNLKISSFSNGKISKDIIGSFDKLFERLKTVDENFISKYEELYEKTINYNKDMKKSLSSYEKAEDTEKIEPNKMQEGALLELSELRNNGEKRGLLISATGTGKTFLSAFDVKRTKPKRVLFLAHRKVILEKAKESYKNLIKDKSIDLYKEGAKQPEYMFAMVQTITRDRHLNNFARNEFDYIVIDEIHHGGAKTYRKIIDYFQPKFLLGMTATPERTDDFNIYEMFNYNSVLKMRLHNALEEGLLCPFHYFGVSEIEVDGKIIDEKSSIKNLVQKERVDSILEKSEYYGYSGNTLYALIFVSRKEEARLLNEEFRRRGVKSEYLVGDSTDTKREECIAKLERGEINYIITVDIFNEGVDIPCVNQIILMRPTLSSIIYIQQLGRGLRKYKDKEYVVILDFIGNYEKNFLIPIAISGDNSYNKDYMRLFLREGTNIIPGESSISFQEVVRDRIFENINKTNFSIKKNIEKDFKALENQLGRTPYLTDFYENNMISPTVILKYKRNYHQVLSTFNRGEELSIKEEDFLTFLSIFFTPSKRIHEMVILKIFLEKKRYNIELLIKDVESYLEKNYGLKGQKSNIENGIQHFSKEIFKNLSTLKKHDKILIKKNDYYEINEIFISSYKNNTYFRKLIDDLIKYNLSQIENRYIESENGSILRYGEYTKQEAFWHLNLDFNNGYQVSGYTVFPEKKEAIIFVTLDGESKFSDYDNTLIDRKCFPWFSKKSRRLERNNELTIEGKIAHNFYKIHVFMKKKISENFYYLGEVDKVINAQEITLDSKETLVSYIFKLKEEIPIVLFNYLNS